MRRVGVGVDYPYRVVGRQPIEPRPLTQPQLTVRDHLARRVGACRKPSDGRSPSACKRVLNVIPSRDTEQDWQIQHADAAGAARRGARASRSRRTCVRRGGRSAIRVRRASCVGWATADALLRWHFVKSSRIKNTETMSKRFIWMASKETDEYSSAPDHFHRERGDEPEGCARRRAQVRCREGERPAVRRRPLSRARRRRFYAVALAAEDPQLLQPVAQPRRVGGRLAPLARRRAGRSSPGSTSTARGTTPAATPATWTPTSPKTRPRRARRLDRRLHARPLHHPQQLGARRWGRQGLRLRVARLRAGRVHRGVRHLRVIALDHCVVAGLRLGPLQRVLPRARAIVGIGDSG